MSGPIYRKPRLLRCEHLTPSQICILQRSADGESYREIGEQLKTSPAYIKNLSHFAQMFLGADNRTHAVALAMRRGLIK